MAKARRKRTTRQKLRDDLTEACHTFVKLRDKRACGPMCRICGKLPGSVAYHLVPAGRGDNIRWDSTDIVMACASCNFGEMRNRSKYRDKHVALFGSKFIEDLEAKARKTVQLSQADLRAMLEDYRKKTERVCVDVPKCNLEAIAKELCDTKIATPSASASKAQAGSAPYSPPDDSAASGGESSSPDTVAGLRPAPYNPRKITPSQLALLGNAMRTFGDLSGIVLNKRTGNVIGGHQRLKHLDPAWKILKQPCKDSTGTIAMGSIVTPFGAWQYREVDWTLQMEKAANIAANQHGGDFDIPLLKDLLVELNDGQFDISLTGFQEFDLKKLIDWSGTAGNTEADAVPEAPKVAKSRLGDIWVLGQHRLLCGDSTDSAQVARFMGAEMADMMWTDPPYGVSYVGKTKDALTIQNDGGEGLPELLQGAFETARIVLRPGAALYIAHPARALSKVFMDAFIAAGWTFRQGLVWVKDSMVLGHSDYHYKHEPIIFGYTPCPEEGRGRGRGRSGWYGGNDAVTVFDIPRPKRSEEHPTMKPVELVEAMLINSCPPQGIVYEPFSGSGTTIIASEKLGRACRAIELDPIFVDVAVRRWEEFTGKVAVLQPDQAKVA